MLSSAAIKARKIQDDGEIAEKIVKEWGLLFGQRGNWESHWQEIAERIWPAQSKLFQNRLQNLTQGEKRNEYVFDSTGSIALSRFGSILDSLLTPQNAKWHSLRASDKNLNKNRDVRLWFESLNDLLFKTRYAPLANFTSQNQINYRMLGAYGSGCVFVDDLLSVKGRKDGIRYRTIHMSGIYFRENHQGIVDTALRYYRQTARQAVQEFGEDMVPESIKEKAKSSPDTEFFFIHAVKPREDFDPLRPDIKGMPWGSYYVSVQEKMLVREGGFRVFPYCISRYEQSPGEVYGRSPAMDVLPALKTLNEEKKVLLKQGHRTVDPVLLAYDDGIIDGFSLKPGSINAGGVTAAGQPLIHPLPVGNVQISKELMDDERQVINDAFLVTLFQILTEQPQMTATEVMERTREKGILLAPTIGRQQSEYLGPMIDREIDILVSQGKIDPMPRALLEAKGEYTVEYESPMARASKAEEATGFLRTLETAMNIAGQTGDPSVLDIFDFDICMPGYADIQGMPASWRSSDEMIAQRRQARQQQMQQAQAIQAAPGAAAITKSVATAKKLNSESGPQQ